MHPPNAGLSSAAAANPDRGVEGGCDPDRPLGNQLKVYFDRLTDGPVPDRLMRLTEELEAAFERGDLRCDAAGTRQR